MPITDDRTPGHLAQRLAAELYVVPEPAVPIVVTAVVGVSALGMAILAAIVPGWRAARRRVASVLRAGWQVGIPTLSGEPP